MTPGGAAGEPAIVQLAPGSGLTVINLVRTIDPGGSVGSINIERRIDRPEIQISGVIPVRAAPISRTVAVLNPTLFFAQSVKDALIARGITVSGDAVDGDDIAAELAARVGLTRRELVTTASAPLRDVATVLMKVSQNQYAETLLKAVGAARGGAASTTGGRLAAAETFRAWGIPDDGYVMSDGSGLSRYNYVAPSAITAILARMHQDAATSRRVRRYPADRRTRRHDLDADAPLARRGQRHCEDRFDRQRAFAIRLRQDPQWRDAGVFDPGE